MIKRNESFICINCGHKNPMANKTCRNHCRKCLYSKHIDNIPGDRSNVCNGLMEPVDIIYKKNKGYMITHKCIKCHIIKLNKLADDDDINCVVDIMQKSFNNRI